MAWDQPTREEQELARNIALYLGLGIAAAQAALYGAAIVKSFWTGLKAVWDDEDVELQKAARILADATGQDYNDVLAGLKASRAAKQP